MTASLASRPTFRHTTVGPLDDAPTPVAPLERAFTAGAIALADGRLAHVPTLPAGVTVSGFSRDAAAPGVNAPHDAAHDADRGVTIDVAAGTALAAPLHLHNLGSQAEGARRPRITVRIGAGARVTLVESWDGDPADVGLHHVHAVVWVGADAVLEHVVVQRQGAQARHLHSLHADVGARGAYGFTSLALGAKWARVGVDVRLSGRDASVRVGVVALGGPGQHLDHTSHIVHAARGTRSEELGRAAVSGAKAVWASYVTVTTDAPGADVRQDGRSLVLDAAGRATNDPQLEIHVDEVKASHGATIGRLDRDAWFFLRARGIPDAQARRLLTGAFIGSVPDAVADPVARALAQDAVAARLSEVLP